MQVVVEQADRIEKDGWRISNADLCAGVERILNMPRLPKEKIGKAAGSLGLTKSKWAQGTIRGWSVTHEKIESFRGSVPTVPSVPAPCESKGKAGDRYKTEVSPSVPGAVRELCAGDSRGQLENGSVPGKTVGRVSAGTVGTLGTVPQGNNPEFDFNDPDFPDEVTI
jgi:hypothetical protein